MAPGWPRAVAPSIAGARGRAPASAGRADRQTKSPGNLSVSGAYVGVGVRHALFPLYTRLGALAFAGGVFPDATLRGRRNSGLMAGPSRPFPAGIFRVRPLRPVRTSPAGDLAPDVVLTRLQRTSRRHRDHGDGAGD